MALPIINVYSLDNWNQIGLFTRMAEKAQPAFKVSDFSLREFASWYPRHNEVVEEEGYIGFTPSVHLSVPHAMSAL